MKKRRAVTSEQRDAAGMNTKANLEAAIVALGYTLVYQEYCECADTPGLLGQIRGVTDYERKRVRISTKANRTDADKVEILAHEIRHVVTGLRGWDCRGRA